MWKKIRPFLIQGIIVIAVIIAGIWIARSYLSDEQVAQKRQRPDKGLLVSVETYEEGDYEITIESTGTVRAAKSMNLKSEASGRVTYVHPKFYPGGRIKKGEVIVKINTEDYKIALENQRINLRQKEAALMVEKAKGSAASVELDLMKKTFDHVDLSAEEQKLIKRQPQLEEALAAVEAAKNNVKQAQLNLDRSTVKAPFDLIVSENNVIVGDYVGGQTTLGSAISTEAFWITASIFPEQMHWLGIPGVTSEEASGGKITYEISGKTIERPVKIVSLMPQVESLGRMVQILLEVKDPFGEPVADPLVLGSFVRIYLDSKDKLHAIRLPRARVHEGNRIYVCNEQKKLEIRSVTAGWKDNDYYFVTDGLKTGERILTTLLSSPVDGTKLRIEGEDPQNAGVDFGFDKMGPGGPGGRPPRH